MVILFCAFAGILIISFAVAFHFTRPRKAGKSVVKRLNIIHRPPNSADVELIELVQERQGFVEQLSELLTRFQFSAHLALLSRHAGLTDSVGSIVLMSAGLGAAGGLLAWFFLGKLIFIAIATTAGSLARYGMLRWQKSSRLKKFGEALPDAIELMARALRAGHSTGSSIEIIAEQSAQPLAGEFEQCFQQQKFGIPFRDAIVELGERVPSRDLHFLITAILVQKETGGDLTEILDRTTIVIRERVRIEGEVKTYTAQGRLTGWILGLLPVIMLVLINIATPGYSHVLFYDPLGQKLLWAGAILIVIGGLIIRKVVDIKV